MAKLHKIVSTDTEFLLELTPEEAAKTISLLAKQLVNTDGGECPTFLSLPPADSCQTSVVRCRIHIVIGK